MGANRLADLQARHGELVARSHLLRGRLAQESQPLQHALALADRGRDRLRWLAAHPQWVAAAIAIPLLLRPRRTFAWALKLWWGWRMIGRLRGLRWSQPTRLT